MDTTEAIRRIKDGMKVTPQRVALAKAQIMAFMGDTTEAVRTNELIAQVLGKHGARIPAQIMLDDSLDPTDGTRQAGEGVSWTLATIEAIWGLVHGGLLLPSDNMWEPPISLNYSTVTPGSGGTSGGLPMSNLSSPVPAMLRLAPSARQGGNLTEPDLYLLSLATPTMHEEVAAAFAEAVRCFREGLYSAGVAMLGKGSEGAWIELGASLMNKVTPALILSVEKQQRVLEDANAGIMKKIESVRIIYARHDLFSPEWKSSGIRPQELEMVSVWSDQVRDARNTIHFGVLPVIPNTYEKLATLLLGAAQYVRILYRVKAVVDTKVATP